MSLSTVVSHLRRISDPETYHREQWWALALSFFCIGTDIWAAISTYHGFGRQDTPLHPVNAAYLPVVWGTEASLALVAICLLSFAFSTRPITAR
jgi:hypothetical protein